MSDDGWRTVQLDQVADVVDSLHQTPAYVDHGIAMVRVTDIKGGFLDLAECKRVTSEVHQAFTRNHKPKPGNIVFSRVGTYGQTSFVATGQPFCLGQNTAVIVPKVNNRFLYYTLQSPAVKAEIEQKVVGSTQKTISLKHIRELGILLPASKVQDAIASILGSLDDKIELNRRMNRTLEELAAAIFKAWFVDFEPVKAKAAGAKSFPSMPQTVFDSLPTTFVDSPLGPIPKGWRNVGLGDVAACFDSRRVPLSGRERAKRRGTFPYYGAASVMDYADHYLFDGIYVLAGEDGSVITDDGFPVLQYVWGQFWVNNHAHVLQGRNGICSEHLMLSLKQSNIVPYVTGAVQPKLNQGNMNRIPFILPTKETADAFAAMIAPLFAKYRANVDESATLAIIRDALLPKLLSGEIRVKAAEKAVEEVA